MDLVPPVQGLAELILRGFERQQILPRMETLAEKIRLFEGLTEEQIQRLGAACAKASFSEGDQIFSAGDECGETYLLLEGEVQILMADGERAVGKVGPGECLGEISLLMGTKHSAAALVSSPVRAAVLPRNDLQDLVRQRPDIGVVLFRNLARGLGEKLRRADLGQ